MKKVFVLSAVLLVFVSAKTFSLGIGVGFDGGYDKLWGVLFLVSPGEKDHLGWRLEVDKLADITWWNVSASYDHWFIDSKITDWNTGRLNWFLGTGVNVWTSFYSYKGEVDDNLYLGMQIRVPFGLHVLLGKNKHWDIYTAFIPQLGATILQQFHFPDWSLKNGAIGIRYRF
ncbi:MAG: hypothetical protein Ta2A_23510 [Treponemataceae bacterium]|nr:MAG: hypothetical protein Ta2A_23510 [Treponemataceae bacterium]